MSNSKIENKESKVFNLINWKSIIVGSIITLIAYLIYAGSYVYYLYYYSGGLYLDDETTILISLLLTVIAGFMVAILNKTVYKDVIMNLTLATIIGIYISNLIIGLMVIFSGMLYSALPYVIIYPIIATITFSIPIGLLEIFGAFIGTSIKKLIQKNKIAKWMIK